LAGMSCNAPALSCARFSLSQNRPLFKTKPAA
jgi:hypothetical protein